MHIVSNAADRARSGAYDAASGARAQGSSTHAAQRGGGSGAAPAGALGTYAYFASAPAKPAFSVPDPTTGEVVELTIRRGKGGISQLIPAPLGTGASRARRWARKRAVDELSGADYLRAKETGESASKTLSRVWKCHRWSRPHEAISAMHSAEFGKAFYAGLQVCANVHACPLCRAKIAERRRLEVQAGIDAAKANGWRVVMFTQTVRHGIGDDIRTLIGQICDAQRDFTGTRRAMAWRKAIGVQGFIRSLEITYGQHGWHPHFHCIVFLKDCDLSHEQLEAEGFALWRDCAIKNGLPEPLPGPGFQVQGAEQAGAYVTKWGMAEELTKGASKTARGKGVTPEQLLDLYAQGDKQAGALFCTYVEAMKGRSTLRWSPGLKNKLAVEVLTDEEIAERVEDENAEHFANITGHAWLYIVKRGWQDTLLHFIETDRKQAFALLAEAEATSPRRSLAADGLPPAWSSRYRPPKPLDDGYTGAGF